MSIGNQFTLSTVISR